MILVICGPTCTGKSDIAFSLAKKINAEIVNADAFQIYKELDIGVNKPPKVYFSEIPHHLFNIVSASKPYSIKEYQTDARKVIEDILSRGKSVIMVGGSGLYIRSALYDYTFSEEDHIDMSKYEAMDNITLHKVLEGIDEVDAKKIHPNNRKRVLRAIEIYLQNGVSKTELNSSQKHKPIYENTYFVMRKFDRNELNLLIEKRVDEMMKRGLLKEVEEVYNSFKDCQAIQAIGYKEFIPYFKHTSSLEECVEKVKLDTKQYAKRQVTFFKNQFEMNYFEKEEDILKVINNG